MTMQFEAIFTRYKRGVRIQSAPVTIHADGWDHANARAQDMLTGMAAADKEAAFDMARLSSTGLGGEWVKSGGETIWENYVAAPR